MPQKSDIDQYTLFNFLHTWGIFGTAVLLHQLIKLPLLKYTPQEQMQIYNKLFWQLDVYIFVKTAELMTFLAGPLAEKWHGN